ncbi:MAG TPA: 2'-5' RNA ligase family protein [Verrucomicrobiae bacterium]|jgi:hypothetical protein|nr:2'-5' RNA ligase family protein [Verrucomicrobiae bacterium]
MNRLRGYSLWLDPADPAQSFFSGLIRSLSSAFQTPVFEPHVTLAGQILLPEKEVLSKAKALSAGLKPCELTFEGCETSAAYFKALFLARPQPMAWLRAARDMAVKLFQMPDASYDPHLSLAYGEGIEFKEKFPALKFPVRVPIESLSVMKTEGPVPEWKPTGRYLLGEA